MSDQFHIYLFDDDYKSNTRLTVKFATYAALETYIRKPYSLVQGLAKVGGFLGLMKLFSLLLSFYYQKLFEKELKAFINK